MTSNWAAFMPLLRDHPWLANPELDQREPATPAWTMRRLLRVVLTTVVMVLLVSVLLVATALAMQTLSGGAPLTPLTPDHGLDL